MIILGDFTGFLIAHQGSTSLFEGSTLPPAGVRPSRNFHGRPATYKYILRIHQDDAMNNILLVIVILLLIGALPTWPYSANWGYYPSGGLGLLLLILVVLLLTGRRSAA